MPTQMDEYAVAVLQESVGTIHEPETDWIKLLEGELRLDSTA